MWDRLRTHKDGGSASHADRRKPNSHQNWQNPPRANSPYGYSFSIKGGPAPPRPPREFDYPTSPSEHPADYGVEADNCASRTGFSASFHAQKGTCDDNGGCDTIPRVSFILREEWRNWRLSLLYNDKVNWMVQRKAQLRPLSLSLLFVAVRMTSLFMVESALQVTRSKKFSHTGTTTGATGFLQRQRAHQD
ncbi:hypothetical protein SUNI508_06129 [Seiridium unicorne]|uniref:Uncharacterized protein n=1 Tax=Seiridium unicorne TaxID=138068 RepID=A0ABR2V2D0_9PEZI